MSQRQSQSTDKIIVDRTKRRSASGKMISEARKYASSSMHRPVKYEVERLHSYAENHVNAKLALPLFVMIIAVVSTQWVGAMLAAYWAAIVILSYGVLFAVSSRYLQTDGDEKDLPKWRRRFMGAQLLVAFAWSIFAFYHCASCNIADTFLIIQFSAILVFQAVTMMLSHSFGANLLMTSAPPTIVLALRLILTFQPAPLVMGGILIGSQVFFYFVANRFRISILSALAHHHERENLIAELETAKSMSEEARRRAEEANLAKSRFLATMSHELRTPLNAVIGFSEIMQEELFGALGSDKYREYCRDIHHSGTFLLGVINDILDMSKIEAGRFTLDFEQVGVDTILEETLRIISREAANKEITIREEVRAGLEIEADRRAVKQILLNLLSNAVKFSNKGGEIFVRARMVSKCLRISIEDKGIGISQHDLSKLGRPFEQAQNQMTRNHKGSGLGLAISASLARMHGGKLKIRSREGEGTIVSVQLPLSQASHKKQKAKEKEPEETGA
ncbi:MAG: HAMP domain-containing histidine kinase [Nitratireductor sp.]|nr:HAMP domain-containing histidine kinase [Nitratireductor sp.]